MAPSADIQLSSHSTTPNPTFDKYNTKTLVVTQYRSRHTQLLNKIYQNYHKITVYQYTQLKLVLCPLAAN